MQITPNANLLQALSRSLDPAATAAARKATGNEAARAAARAVFAQIAQTSGVAAPAAGQLTAGQSVRATQTPAIQNAAPPLPATPPTQPMPRGSIVNILV